MRKWLPAALLCLVAGACAKTVTVSTGESAREYLTLWMQEYHPNVPQSASGIYILSDTPGDGAVWNKDMPYTYASVTIRQLSGTISSTTEESLAKQLGTYAKANYYGPQYFQTGEGYSYAGVDALLEGMRMGGTRQAVIPAWLLTSNRYNTQEDYIDDCSSSASLIYTITLAGQTDDVYQLQKDQIQGYVMKHFGSNYSTRTINGEDGIFYFISDTTAFEGVTQHNQDTTMSVDYTGMLLDGHIFDTNVERTARDAGIYVKGNTYSSMSVSLSSTLSDIAMSSGSSLIDGFKAGLYYMHWKGQKATVIFTSDLGYGSSGSSTIPSWAPLRFDLELL